MTLLDDKGWEPALTALEKGDDYSRARAAAALSMRADAVMPKASVSFARLGKLFDRAMNQDPHPAARAGCESGVAVVGMESADSFLGKRRVGKDAYATGIKCAG